MKRQKIRKYTYKEVKQILDERQKGLTGSQIAKNHNRTSSALSFLLAEYSMYSRSGKTRTDKMALLFNQYEKEKEGNTNGVVHQYEPVPVQTSTRENDLGALENAFSHLQTVIVEVIEHEADRRSKAEVEKYKTLYEEKDRKIEDLLSQMKESNLAAQLRKRFALFSS